MTQSLSSSDRNGSSARPSSETMVDIKVLDHFMVGGSIVVSFSDRGLI